MQTLWSLNICHKTRRFIRTSDELVIRTKKTTSLLQSAHQQTPPLLHPSFHPPSAHGRSTFKPLKKNPTTTPSERQHHATCITLQLLVKQTKVWSENNPSLLKTLSRWIDTAQRGGSNTYRSWPTWGWTSSSRSRSQPAFPWTPRCRRGASSAERYAALSQRRCQRARTRSRKESPPGWV